MLIGVFVIAAIAAIAHFYCGKTQSPQTIAIDEADTLLSFVKVTDTKTVLDKCWQLPYIREWYKNRIPPPPMDYSTDLKSLSYQDLWYLKYELLARNGYLFMEPDLRAHFSKFKWYQPIYDSNDFVVELNNQEYAYLKKIINEEKLRLRSSVISVNNNRLVNYDFTINREQFTSIPAELASALHDKNFVIVPANHDQLFTVYEENYYDYIPSFITTDLFMQTVQKHIATIMKNLEKEKIIGLITSMLAELYQNVQTQAAQSKTEIGKESAEWAIAYYAIPLSLISGKEFPVPARLNEAYSEELGKCRKALGFNSPFLNSKLAEYSQFQPRGNYAGDAQLEKYFRCIKWLNSAKMVIASPSDLSHPVCLAALLNQSKTALMQFNNFSETVKFLAGDENNISVALISQLLSSKFPGKSCDELLQPGNLQTLYQQLKISDPRKFQVPTGTQFAQEEFSKMTVVFSAGRYTLDNEIFSKLVHVRNPERKRPVPKALDIFAAMGNHMADSLLHYMYKEQVKWPAYDDSLTMLKNRFAKKNDWDKSIYGKTMQTMIDLCQKNPAYPLFMQTPYWEKKNLNTALGGYTQLRHDFTLYIEELMAAECGGGDDGPPPPVHLAYVEPNIAFWTRTLELLRLVESELAKHELLTEKTVSINGELISLNTLLLDFSQKEISGKLIRDDEFEKMSSIGGAIESLTLKILDNDHLPDRDREISLIINVYGHRDSLNNLKILNEALGKANEIYVLASINGLPYITKGAVWSQFEFISGKISDDDAWKGMINGANKPDYAPWMNDIMIKTEPLKSTPLFRSL